MTYGQFILTRFVPRHDGQPLDPDRAFGEQCVDVDKQLTDELAAFGIRDISHWNTVSGGAEGIWRKTHPTLLKYFDKIPASGRPFQVGDIVVFRKNPLPDGYLGHTGICLEDTGLSLKLFQQMGGTGVHEGVAHKFTFTPSSTWYKYIVGALRPKPETLRLLGLDGSKPITCTVEIPASQTPATKSPSFLLYNLAERIRVLNKTVELWNLDFTSFGEAKGHKLPKGTKVIADYGTKHMGETYALPQRIQLSNGKEIPVPEARVGFNIVDLDLYTKPKATTKIKSSPVTPVALAVSAGGLGHGIGLEFTQIAEAIAGLYASGALTTGITQVIKTKIPSDIFKRYPRETVWLVSFAMSWGAISVLPVFQELMIHPNLKHALAGIIGAGLATLLYHSGKLNGKG